MWTPARFATPTLAALFLAALPTPVGAQQDGQYRAMRPGVTVDLTVQRADAADLAGGEAVDTTLLRAYASRFDYHKVDEEVRRLKELHPSWTPPTDLFAPKAAAVDERGLWTNWERGDIAAVDREIAILRSLNPGWTPPQKLTDLVEGRRMRDAVAAAAISSDWDGVVRLAAGKPALFTCDQIENLWDLAQAQFRTGNKAAAYATYGNAMETCRNADLRLATLQKALANRDNDALKALIEREAGQSRNAVQEARFAAIQRDFGGNGDGAGKGGVQVAATAPDKLGEALGRLGKGRSDVAEVSWIQETARDKRDARAAQGLGWYYFNTKKWNEASTWFKSSMDWKPSAKAAEGLVYTWQKLGRDDEARTLAASWAGKAPKLKEVLKSGGGKASLVVAAFEKGDFATVLSLTEPGRGPEAASGQTLRGWTLLKLNRPAEAARAFDAALKQAGSDKAKAADAAQGLALANNAQGLSREARAVVEAHAVAPEKSARLDAAIMVQDALAAFNRGSFNEALRLIGQVKRLTPEDQSLAMIEAWSLYKTNRYAEAQTAFKRLAEVYGNAEASDGLRLATAQVNRRWE
jgi:tetratricopeptide (TPR) repeat protein